MLTLDHFWFTIKFDFREFQAKAIFSFGGINSIAFNFE